MKIRAAVLEESGLPAPYAVSRPLNVKEVELDGPGQGEVLVRIVAAGLCHSDLSVIDGNRPRPLPMVLGHEAAGVVEETGPGVFDLKRGDHVVCVFVPSCGVCEYCCGGRPALCIPGAAANGAGSLLSGQRRLHAFAAGDSDFNHHLGVSAFAEYATVARQSLVKVDPALDFKHAALFGCAVLTGVGAALNGAHVAAGSVVAVIGLGGVGMAALLGARAAGAERIIAIDVSPTKLEWARELGATDAFLATDDDVESAAREASGGGVETVLELAGSVKALTLGYRILRRGGSLVTAGLPPPKAEFSIPAVSLVADEKTVRGSYLGSCVPARDIPRYVRLFQSGKLPVEKLLTREFHLDDINTGFDMLREGHLLRGLLALPH
jgi:alcohol dehydrogenase